MLITQLKPKEEILSLAKGKTVLLICEGCREVSFPETETEALQKELSVSRTDVAVITTDYVCNCEHLKSQLLRHNRAVSGAGSVLVFSCGVGVQTAAEVLPGIAAGAFVYAACDTLPLPGLQGLTPLEYDCAECGECYLNVTGGICPVTACSKGLVNGQCGGAKNGKCEVDSDMECGWERINKRISALHGTQDERIVSIRNYEVT